MTLAQSPSVDRVLSPLLLEALAFEAPYVVERLVKDQVVASAAQAEQLFTEAKRYLVLSAVNDDVAVGMCSARVDEAWHTFILYTAEYAEFCTRYFGRYMGHAPKNAPTGSAAPHHHRPELGFPEFIERYEELFGELLPDVWYDSLDIAPDQRVFNDSAGRMQATREGSSAELLTEQGDPVLSANGIVHDALAFIADTGAFYVRELPGGLTDAEKVRLVETLLTVGTLRLAP